jgi:serine/threonine-protein kinase
MTRTSNPRTIFTSKGYSYEIYGTQVKHCNYDTLLLAWRKSLADGTRVPVVMKPFPLSADNGRQGRAYEEVQIATYLQHPNIASVLGIASQNDRAFYVVMENMPGLYLATVLDLALLLGRALSPALSAYVAAMVADALSYVHGRSDREGQPLHIIHRAVGPMSVRVSFDGRVKLTNFGTAYSELRDRWLTPPGLLRQGLRPLTGIKTISNKPQDGAMKSVTWTAPRSSGVVFPDGRGLFY